MVIMVLNKMTTILVIMKRIVVITIVCKIQSVCRKYGVLQFSMAERSGVRERVRYLFIVGKEVE